MRGGASGLIYKTLTSFDAEVRSLHSLTGGNAINMAIPRHKHIYPLSYNVRWRLPKQVCFTDWHGCDRQLHCRICRAQFRQLVAKFHLSCSSCFAGFVDELLHVAMLARAASCKYYAIGLQSFHVTRCVR